MDTMGSLVNVLIADQSAIVLTQMDACNVTGLFMTANHHKTARYSDLISGVATELVDKPGRSWHLLNYLVVWYSHEGDHYEI